jgi:integrase
MPRPRTGSVKWNKQRKYWQARLDWVDENGKDQCRKRRVASKTEGGQIVKQWIRELEDQGSDYIHADRMTFEKLAQEYDKERLIPPVYKDGVKVMGLRDWRGQKRRLAGLVAHFGQKRIRSITATDLDRYRKGRLQTRTKLRKGARSVADVNRSLALLRTVLTFAVKSGWLIRNPFSMATDVIKTAQEVTRTRVYSTDEQRRLLKACQNPFRQHIYPLILTALDSGARSKELLSLKWGNVDLSKGALLITAENAKTNQARTIDLEAVTVAELHKLKAQAIGADDELVFGIKNNFRRAWASAAKEATIKDGRFHDLRATAITTWLLRGMQTEFAMRRSGHTEPKTFQKYVRMCDEIRQKQRAQMREWELAASLTALASAPAVIDAPELEASGFVN